MSSLFTLMVLEGNDNFDMQYPLSIVLNGEEDVQRCSICQIVIDCKRLNVQL
mgnify:CR=1 FL=1